MASRAPGDDAPPPPPPRAPIRVALVGVGNCASALVQGVHFYRRVGGDKPAGPAIATVAGPP
jgi:myo-inositol-1-phosphate synthase